MQTVYKPDGAAKQYIVNGLICKIILQICSSWHIYALGERCFYY